MKPWNRALERYAETVARETGRLLATLATHDDARMRLDWLLETVFVAALDELAERGVPRRVAADMLGVSHRTLQRQYAAAVESLEVRGRSVWTTILETVREGTLPREELEGRLGHVPPVIIASVLNDMMESGWVAEVDGVLTLGDDPDEALSDAALQTHVLVRRRSDPSVSPADVAADLGVDLKRVRRAWDASGALEVEVAGSSIWMAMERCYKAATLLLRETADNPGGPRNTATTWMVRLDDKPPEVQAKLVEFIDDLRGRIEELVEPVRTSYDSSETNRYWLFTGFQTIDLEE